jgi:hypothetical protein
MVCPACRRDIPPGGQYCASCGAPTAQDSKAVQGASKIELEPALVNALLAAFASRPGGPQLRLEEGRLMVRVGDHSLQLNPLHLEDVAQAALQAGPLGNLKLSVDGLRMDQQGLQIQLRLE